MLLLHLLCIYYIIAVRRLLGCEIFALFAVCYVRSLKVFKSLSREGNFKKNKKTTTLNRATELHSGIPVQN